jgi:penicillin-binding protein 2
MKVKKLAYNNKLRNYREFNYLYRSRTFQLIILCLFIAFVLMYRLYDLQVLNHTKLEIQSDNNRLSLLPIFPYRGRIFDRNGQVLADNKAQYELRINNKLPQKEKNRIIKEISARLGFDFQNALKHYRKYRRLSRKQQTTPFVTLTDVQAAEFSGISFLYANVNLDYRIVRTYPYKEVASHLLGHLGLVDAFDLKDRKLFSQDRTNVNAQIKYVGKKGVERHYDRLLRGRFGYQIIEIDAGGKKVKDIEVSQANDGVDLQLTIDVRLQNYINQKIQNLKASVVLMDVSNGEILAMSSGPSYDNNVWSSKKGVNKLYNDKRKPLLNRSTHGLYPPASVIKPFIALAGLHSKVLKADEKYFAGPYYTLKNVERRFHDWKKEGHGLIDMNQAIAQSSDVYFYDLGFRLGINRIESFLSQFPFGKKTGIDLPGEAVGVLPSRQWKYAKIGKRWVDGETLITSIGQGFFLVTPLQLATAISSLANHGEIITPSLVRNDQQVKLSPSQRVKWYAESNWNKIKEAMHNVVSKPYGTAYQTMSKARYSLAGKTGTAQVVNLVQSPEKRQEQKENLIKKYHDHSIFVAFAPYNKPQVAIVTIIENGGNGSGIATTLSKQFLDKYFQYY